MIFHAFLWSCDDEYGDKWLASEQITVKATGNSLTISPYRTAWGDFGQNLEIRRSESRIESKLNVDLWE